MIHGICPACQSRFEIEEEPDLGIRVTCPDCSVTYEVTWLYPFTLDYLETNEPDQKDDFVSLENAMEQG
jgi:lysine biosynthesis protein LysW